MNGRAQGWLNAGGHFEWTPTPPMRHTDKLSIFHAEFGDPEAPPLLMVHGFPTSSIDWQDLRRQRWHRGHPRHHPVPGRTWQNYLAAKPGDNEFWLLPRANHYLQNDQPREFVEVVKAALSNSSPDAPGALSTDPGAPGFLDRSRTRLPTAQEVLASQ